MSVLIKGMDMPQSCRNCPFQTYFYCENRCLANRGKPIKFVLGKDRGVDCPFVRVSTPHGRLIDADAFLATIRPLCAEDTQCGCTLETVKQLLVAHISAAPTIIEAEGGGEDV